LAVVVAVAVEPASASVLVLVVAVEEEAVVASVSDLAQSNTRDRRKAQRR